MNSTLPSPRRRRPFGRDISGSIIAEAALMSAIIFVVTLGGIDFLFAFYQYNAASKAVQLGARIAAVWDPVSKGLNGSYGGYGPSGGLAIAAVGYNDGVRTWNVGDPGLPYFKITCNDASASTLGQCNCSGFCSGVSSGSADYNSAAMNAIVYGRGSATGVCNVATSTYAAGMCSLLPSLTPANVKVTYTQTGLGYVGRPIGPAPTIAVSLQNVSFTFYFLGGLLKFVGITMPSLVTTVTGEYMSSASP